MRDVLHAWRGVFRVALALYTAALLTATHWPGMVIHGPVDRTDLIIHACVFCLWTLLLFGAGLVSSAVATPDGGERELGLGRRLAWVFVLGVCFAVFDELTQPLFSRVADPWDLAADIAGVLLAIGLIVAACRVVPGLRGEQGGQD